MSALHFPTATLQQCRSNNLTTPVPMTERASDQPVRDKNGNQLPQDVLNELIRLVKETDHDTTTIAKKLGVNRATVYRRIRDLKLHGQPYPPVHKRLGRPPKNPLSVEETVPKVVLPFSPAAQIRVGKRRAGYPIPCDRTRPQCASCRNDGIECQYIRSNSPKRSRKTHLRTRRGRPGRLAENDCNQREPDSACSDTASTTAENTSQQQNDLLFTDIEVARVQLQDTDVSQHSSLLALSSLAETSAAVWLHASEYVNRTHPKFFVFEEEPTQWVDEIFAGTLNRGGPMMIKPPQHVLEKLRSGRPDDIHERAWLVTYYSVLLAMVSSTDPSNHDLKTKLRCNLWLAFNDVRLLLEPSEANIQALLLLASHVEEFTMPALSWMLTTNACRMMQALGVNHRRLDSPTRERRLLRFWHLSLLDQGMAVIFGRTPIFHRTTVRQMPRPALAQMMDFQPHVRQKFSGTFGPHFIHRMLLLAPIMADIWSCLNEVPSPVIVSDVLSEIEAWYSECENILQAAATTEKPFLDEPAKASIDLGLNMVKSQYYYFVVLLTRTDPHLKTQCLDSAQRSLHLLQYLVSDSEEPYNGIIWQLVCKPFTPFLTLFGEILSDKTRLSNRDHLAAMECLPRFLHRMATRNSLASKLESVATIIVQHANSIVQTHCGDDALVAAAAGAPALENISVPDWDAFLNSAMTLPTSTSVSEPNDFNLESWAYNFFSGDAMLDWIGWDTAGDFTQEA